MSVGKIVQKDLATAMLFGANIHGRSMNTPKTKKWISEFQSLLHKIGQDLTSDEIRSLKFLLEPYISHGKLENVQNATDIFTLMQKSEKLSYQNTKLLSTLLKDVDREDQVVKLREFEKALQKSKSVPYNIKKEKLVTHFKKTGDLAQLETLMQENRVVTISGPLGAGKSQTALAFSIDLQKKNSNCIVWYCNAKNKSSLLTSLRSLADELSISTLSPIWSDTDDDEDTASISLIGKELQDQLQKREVKPPYDLIILDDVNNESSKAVQNLVQSILTSEDPNIKFLITTRNEKLLKTYGKLHLKGFTTDESLDFLIQGETTDAERKVQYQNLAERMGNLPLGLYLAKTYMENMSIGPRNFLELLKMENIEDIESQFTEMDLQATEKKLFTAMKFSIYQDLQQNMKPLVFEMFQMTQFLENEEIPICLLEFVYREDGYNDKSKTMMMSNFLVQALQRRSLGTIEGEDENRRLSVHSSVIMTLDLCTPENEKRLLLKKLLWGFSLLFDKDVFKNTDLLRMKLLIPHARAFLRHAEKANLIADYDMLVLITFVYDAVGYGYNFGHFQTISNEYSEKCKNSCFQIMDCDEEEIDASLKKSFGTCDENPVKYYETLTKKKSEALWARLDKMTLSKREILHEIVPRFIQQRFRTQLNMEDLSRRLNPESTDFVINAETYRALVNKELALPLDCMESYFLHELVLGVFYTYGRQFFYQRQKTDFKEARRLLSYMLLANEIGQKLSEKQKQLSPINTLLSEITGFLQARVEDDARLYEDKIEVLQRTAERADVLSSFDVKYHIFGIFKMETSVSNHFQNNCLKLAIRCFTTMLQLDIDANKKLEVYEKGCKLADEILKRAKRLRDRRDIPGYKVRVAQFYISIDNIPQEHLSRAEKLFQDVFPKDFLEEGYQRPLERHELQAGQGLVKCYELTGRQEDADNLQCKLSVIDM